MAGHETRGGDRPTDASHPIGVFDSGLGGLTVVRALMNRLPSESIFYFGDTARVPYGIKSVETISGYARQIADFLLQRGVKLLIIACNTMAAVAYQAVVDRSPVPVLDVIGAGAAAAVKATQTGAVGVIGTPATIQSHAYTRAIQLLDGRIRTYSQACPLFVPLVEEGWLDHPVTRLTAAEYLKPLLVERIDALVLGCTHYPLLKPLLQEAAGPGIALVDSAGAMAEITADLLARSHLEAPRQAHPDHHFFVTDRPYRFQAIGEQFLGRPMNHLDIVHW